MTTECIKCPICGNTDSIIKAEAQGEYWKCGCCGSVFAERLAKREYEKLIATIDASMGAVVSEAIKQEKRDIFDKLRKDLVGKIKAEYVNSAEVVKVCERILEIKPGDFLADFFKVANSAAVSDVAEYIGEIDEVENAVYMELILDFIIRSLKEAYITPTAALLERCARIFTPAKKQEYYTRFETEVALVKDGNYEVGLSRDVFLAYSSKDMPAVRRILEFIESDEIGLTCFAAFRNLQHGRDAVANYESALKEAIDNCSIFLFVSSVNSRNVNCDAFKKEMAYIKNSEMNKHPECRSYAQLPEKYRKLRIEYRLDNRPTPLVDRNMKEFFAGLTYVEDNDQLVERLAACMYRPFEDYEEIDSQNEVKRQTDEIAKLKAELEAQKLADEIVRLKAELEANSKAAEEAKRKAEDEARLKAEAESKIKSELEAKIKADYEVRLRAELEAKNKSETEAKQKADAKAKRKSAEYETKLQNAREQGFEIENGVLVKYSGSATEILIPDNVTTIGERVFYGHSNLTSITISDSVTTIEDSAFNCCRNLTSITIPDSVTTIGERVFYGCSNLTRITIPDSVTTIGDSAFSDCSKLISITIPDSVTTIGNWAFSDCGNLISITIPNSVTTIGSGAFENCGSLSRITISDSVTTIGYKVFRRCSSITCITIPDSVTTIGDSAFYDCGNLISITIPDSVTTIGSHAFDNCRSLNRITIPDSVTTIGDHAFSGCTSLYKINIPSSVTRVGDYVFEECKNLTVRIHKEANDSQWDDKWNKLRSGLISKKVNTSTYG